MGRCGKRPCAVVVLLPPVAAAILNRFCSSLFSFRFIKMGDGPGRGLGHIRMRFNDDLQSQIGIQLCKNGKKVENNGNLLCPREFSLRHVCVFCGILLRCSPLNH